MLVPAVFALANDDHASGRPFLYSGIVFSGVTILLALSTRTLPQGNQNRAQLLSLLGAYLVLPALLAFPVVNVVPALSFRNAYFEMVSCITTTGATVFDLPDRIAPTIHLWRSLVGWLGGFLVWVSAIAILAPMRLGGFEMVLPRAPSGQQTPLGRSSYSVYPMQRLWRFTCDLAPVYGLLTLMAWLCQLFVGEDPFIALCHAMAALSTSGISPIKTLDHTVSGIPGEMVLFAVFIFALSRSTFARDLPTPMIRRWYQDPELRLAAFLVAIVPAAIFAHHWLGILDLKVSMDLAHVLRVYWAGVFTTLSFLTTTGLIAADWQEAQLWSGLTTPGLILMGLALVGGGVATTAGGVKLLRVHALYKHGQLEVSRLIHPSMIISPGHPARRVRQEAAYLAWLFFMIFTIAVAAIMLALSLVQVDFETSIVLTVAALTTTGPLTEIGGDAPIVLAQLNDGARFILCLAMTLGRLETLAIVALLNPEFWRH